MSLMIGQPISYVTKVILGPSPPRVNGRQHMSKVIVITLLPETPSSNQKDFHDHLARVLIVHLFNRIQPVATPPYDAQTLPANIAEGAVEEKVLHRFLDVTATQQAIKVGPKVIMLAFQHVACVEAIREKNQPKTLIFGVHLVRQSHLYAT